MHPNKTSLMSETSLFGSRGTKGDANGQGSEVFRRSQKTKRRIQTKRKSKAKKMLSVQKSRRKSKDQGILDKIAHATEIVGDTIRETTEMRRKMGSRGSLTEG